MTNDDDGPLSSDEAAALRSAWEPGGPEPGLEDAVVARLRARGLLRPPRRTSWMKGLAAAAAASLCFLVGAVAGRGSVHAPATPAGSDYLLLLYGSARFAADPSSESARFKEYSGWARGLAAQGRLVSAGKLGRPAEMLDGPDVLARPASPDEPLGFFVIRSRDADEARRVAEACPHLLHGGRVEVRPVVDESSAR